MKFQKGQSGNPAGRPPKSRALTAILEAAGNKTLPTQVDGKAHARKHLLAAQMWQAATEGEITLPNGQKMELSPEDMIAAAKWIYTHIDGPPKGELELSGTLHTQSTVNLKALSDAELDTLETLRRKMEAGS
jgi:hypothetical protein